MKMILFFFVIMCFFGGQLYADTLAGGFPACLKKKSYDQFIRAYMDKNKPELEYLLKNGCGFPDSGLKVAVLDYSVWDANAKVRIFIGDQAVVMWTHYKNIRRDP